MKRILLLFAFILGLNAQSQTNLTEAIDFTLTLDGTTMNLFSILDNGQWVVLNFGAYWCGPCMNFASDFGQVYEEYGCNTGDVVLVELEYEGTQTQCEDFINTYGGGYDVPYFCNSGYIHDIYGVQAFPTNILINPDGDIVLQDIWPIDYGILMDVLTSYNLEPGNCNLTEIEEIDSKETNNKIFDIFGRQHKVQPKGLSIKNNQIYYKF